MRFSLLDDAKELITNELMHKASSFLDESESGTAKAFSGIIPSLFGAIAHKSSTNDGANIVSDLAGTAYNTGFLNDIHGFFENENGGSLLNKGARLLSGLFSEDKINAFSKIISGFSGINRTSAQTLLSMATPLVLGLLGKRAVSDNLNPSGLSSLLNDRKNTIIHALPIGLNLNSIFHGLESRAKNSPSINSRDFADEKEKRAGRALKWLMPSLLLVLGSLMVLYFSGRGRDNTSVSYVMDSLRTAAENKSAEIKYSPGNSKGKVDSLTGNFIYNLGRMVTINLPDGVGQLEVGENSTENKLYNFLMDRGSKLDTVKGNWFEFTNVHFKSGDTVLDSASAIQLKNITAITKAFPTAEFKIGGYTDNSGDSSANVILSQKRAEIVVAALKKSGAASAAITGAKGYGPQWPLQNNDTPEGKAMNRRVAVNVKAR